MCSYTALIHKDKDSDFGVSFPDLPGCIAAGASLDEAVSMAVEALALHVEGMVSDGETLPAPRSLDALQAEQASRDALLVPICLRQD